VKSTDKNKEQQNLIYDSTEPLISIVKDSSTFVGLDLEPAELETYTEKIDRGWFHGKAGVEIKGFRLDLERKPRKETKTITRAIWRKPQK
jgi:hypothetical protein